MKNLLFSKEEDPIIIYVHKLRDMHSVSYEIVETLDWWYFIPKEKGNDKKQGWKLHLSVIPAEAFSLLDSVASFLIEEKVYWKVCLTHEQLIRLSSAPSPLSQAGKFITIYPENEERAKYLAYLLHEKTKQFHGPAIPSDLRYKEDSQVYYRYGGFSGKQFFYDEETSLRTPYLLSPDGKKLPDARSTKRRYPDWVKNPFPQEEVQRVDRSKGLFGRNLKVRGIIRQSVKGGIYVVSNETETFILKEGRYGTNPDLLGRDMKDRLQNEYNILRKLEHLKIAPQPIEFFEEQGNAYLLMEHLAGQALQKYIEEQNFKGEYDLERIKLICDSLLNLVKQCHSEGLILRDFTPNNIMVARNSCKLIDLEQACFKDSIEAPFMGFTRGYVPTGDEMSPRKDFSYDYYALGAILFFVLTGVHPYLGDSESILFRLPEFLDTKTFLKQDIFPDLVEKASKLLTHKTLDIKQKDTLECQISKHEFCPISFKEELRENAINIAEYLYKEAHWNDPDYLWPVGPYGSLFHPVSFYGGSTGIAHYFCEIAQLTGSKKYYDYAAKVMDWVLSMHPFQEEDDPPGLYFGYAGVLWTLANIAEGLEADHYLDIAIDISHRVAKLSPARLDLTHGAAGIGLMHLELHNHTRDPEQLQFAKRLAQFLVDRMELDADGRAVWGEKKRKMWGFAHGSAGIAYYLLSLYKKTKEDNLLKVIERVNSSLIQAAIPTAYGKGISWPMDTTASSSVWCHWCHGASGVGIYLLAAAQYFESSDLKQMTLKAANTIRFGNAFTSLGQCHGLAGDGEYLLQVSRELEIPEILQDVYRIVRKLYAFRTYSPSIPSIVWSNEGMRSIAPGYMTGYSGIYSFLLHTFYPSLARPFQS